MAEPRIQYAKTSDGVSIALWTMGEGVSFVQMPPVPSTGSQVVAPLPDVRRWYERLAARRRLIRYDNRGFGHSERDVAAQSLAGWLLDLEGVVDHLGLERFVLDGMLRSAPVAVAYAVRHPDRVSHLLLWCAAARGVDYLGVAEERALLALADVNWELYTEIRAHMLLGWSAGEVAERFAAFIRDSATPQSLRAALEAMLDIDVTQLLPQISCPTLVLHRRDLPMPNLEVARVLASHIPDARLAVFEGRSSAPWLEDMEAVIAAIDEFLGPSEAAAGTEPPARRSLVTVLFTDIEGSTEARQRRGDAKGQELVHAHDAIVRQALDAHQGSEIKHTGDGIMASFDSASGALDCAIGIQRAVAEHDPGDHLSVHVGLNAGEPVAEGQDLFGTAVDLAKRVCDYARGGEILVSNVVRELAAGKGFVFADRGFAELRGFGDPVPLYEVRWREAASV